MPTVIIALSIAFGIAGLAIGLFFWHHGRRHRSSGGIKLNPAACNVSAEQLEFIDRECSQIIGPLEEYLRDISSHIRRLSEDESFTIRWSKRELLECAQEINIIVEDFSVHGCVLHMALQLQSAVIALKGTLPVEMEELERRNAEIINSVKSSIELANSFIEDVGSLADRLSGIFVLEGKEDEIRRQVKEHLMEIMGNLLRVETRLYAGGDICDKRQ